MRRLETGDWSRLLGSYACCCCNRRHVATKLKYNQQMGEVKRNDFISAREAAAGAATATETNTLRIRRVCPIHKSRFFVLMK